MSTTYQLGDPFNSDSLQTMVDDFSSTLSVVNDLHRVVEESTDANLVGNMLIAMRRYLDDFDESIGRLSELAQLARQREKRSAA